MTLDQTIRVIIAEEVAAAEKRIRESLQTAPDRDLNFQEALEHLHMSEYTLRRLCKEKRIPHRTYGSQGSHNPRYFFSLQRLDQWKREQEEANYIREVNLHDRN